MRVLTAIPVYNEARHVEHVLGEVRRFTSDILLINDGSTDGTAELLARLDGIQVVTHPKNRGYGHGRTLAGPAPIRPLELGSRRGC